MGLVCPSNLKPKSARRITQPLKRRTDITGLVPSDCPTATGS